MPIRVPPEATKIRDNRITLIRLICTLHDRLVEGDAGLKDKVKQSMQSKGAGFAESDLAVAALRAGPARSSIDPRKLYRLVESGELELRDFLACVTVRKEPLAQFLSGAAVEKISSAGTAPEPSLFTEFKEGVELDFDQLSQALISALNAGMATSADNPKNPSGRTENGVFRGD